MFEKDRDFIRQQVLRVLANWGVAPSARGTGPGDVEDWIDHIVAAKGWEPYWEVDRMPREFLSKGYHLGGTAPAPGVPASTDPYMIKLDALDQKLEFLIQGLHPRYF